MTKFEPKNNIETKKRKRKSKSVISFDEEIVKKENADEIIKRKTNEESHLQSTSNNELDNPNFNADNSIQSKNYTLERKQKKKSTKKNKKDRSSAQEEIEGDILVEDCDTKNTIQSNDSVTEKKKKSKKNKLHKEDNIVTDVDAESKPKKQKKSQEVQESNNGEENAKDGAKLLVEELNNAKDISKRKLKKMKHTKLLEENKLKSEIATQQTALNYLSKWKHCRDQWKFEKLKQIWLSQNMLDCAKIPNEFWDIVVEYFNGSRGFIKKLVLREALKAIEIEERIEEDNVDENQKTKLQRARDLIQHLQD